MASFSKRGIYWRAQVRTKGQEGSSRTFDTKAEAQVWARSIENAMDRGIFIDNSEAQRTTLLEAIERYEKETIARKGYPKQVGIPVDRDRSFRFVVTGDSGGS